MLESSDDLRRKVKKVRASNEDRSIEMLNGGVIAYRTRSTGKGGRGLDDISLIVYDEAQHLTDEQMGASSPTTLVNPNPQVWMAGTGALSGHSAVWWRMRMLALKGSSDAFGWVEHSAEQVSLDADGKLVSIPPDPDDREAWAIGNPGLGVTIPLDNLVAERARLSAEEVSREHLGVWDPLPDQVATGPIPLSTWDALIDAQSTPEPDRCRLAMDTNPERSWFTLCLAGHRADGLIHGEITKAYPSKMEAINAAAEAARTLDVAIICSEASALADDIERAGVEVDTMGTGDQAAATSKLIDATRGEAPLLRHRGEPSLRRALELAQTKPYGDGGITWSRRSTAGDISPLTALTMAYGRLTDNEPEPEPVDRRMYCFGRR